MRIMIKETKQIKELTIYGENGIEWTTDLLGNAGALKEKDEETEILILNQEDFDWWKEYIKNHESDEEEITELAEELNIDINEIYEQINENQTNDLNDEHTIKQEVLRKIRAEYKK